ncbi:MAG: hypothetical protein ACI4UE_03190 [Candidatus Scatovivens sp.]
MNINNLIDKLNNELDRLNKIKEASSDINDFFTNNLNYNDDFSIEDIDDEDNNSEKSENIADCINIYPEIEPNTEETSLTTIKENRLVTAQNIFKKSIRVSLKSFLISLSLSFLNLFI